MVTCDRVRARLAEHAVGGGSRRQRARVSGHLALCADCRKELVALERTGGVLSALPLESAPAGTWGAIRAQIVTRPASSRQHTLAAGVCLFRARWRLALVTVVLLAIGAGVISLSPMHGPRLAVVPVAQADAETRATLEGHLATARFMPLADDAAIGLDLESREGDS